VQVSVKGGVDVQTPRPMKENKKEAYRETCGGIWNSVIVYQHVSEPLVAWVRTDPEDRLLKGDC
jgi:hypothetical protein